MDSKASDRVTGARVPRRGSRARGALAALAFLTLATGGSAVLVDSPVSSVVRKLVGRSPERLLPAVVVAPSGGSFRFIRLHPGPGDPVTFDPCRPVDIVYNEALAPPGTRQLVEDALAEVRERTGLQLEVVGSTDERPSDDRPASDRGRYGLGWSPVLLAWSTADEMPGLAGQVAGLGGGVARSPWLSTQLHYVSGSVTLDADDLGTALLEPQGDAKVRAIVMHELAHLVGLDHVDDPDELMHAENREQQEFGPGDLEGLAIAGAGSCRP